jgi:hypothetical protein
VSPNKALKGAAAPLPLSLSVRPHGTLVSSVKYTNTFQIGQPILNVFPLFSPEGEKYWVPGWSYENVMGTTELSEDYVFLTKSHDHGSKDAIWLVKRYDPDAHMVEFYRVEPGEKVGVVKVNCSEISPDKTEVEVSYKYLALSETGEHFMSKFTQVDYNEFIGKWKELLLDYFASKA